MKNNKKMMTDYKTAVNWLHTNYILQNDIVEIDPAFYDTNAELFCEDEDGNYKEYYQYYITDLSKFDMEWLENTFDLVFGYSPLLDKYILFVPHYGTAWNSVPCEVKSESWWESNGEKYGYKD